MYCWYYSVLLVLQCTVGTTVYCWYHSVLLVPPWAVSRHQKRLWLQSTVGLGCLFWVIALRFLKIILPVGCILVEPLYCVWVSDAILRFSGTSWVIFSHSAHKNCCCLWSTWLCWVKNSLNWVSVGVQQCKNPQHAVRLVSLGDRSRMCWTGLLTFSFVTPAGFDKRYVFIYLAKKDPDTLWGKPQLLSWTILRRPWRQ